MGRKCLARRVCSANFRSLHRDLSSIHVPEHGKNMKECAANSEFE